MASALPSLTLLFLACMSLAATAENLPSKGGIEVAQSGMSGFAPIQNNEMMAQKFMLERKYAEAVPFLLKFHDEQPHNPRILLYLAYSYELSDNTAAAITYYKRALDEETDYAPALVYLNELYLYLHDLTSAEAQLAEYDRRCDQDCGLHNILADAINKYISGRESQPLPPLPWMPDEVSRRERLK